MSKECERIDSDVMTKEEIWKQFPDMWVALAEVRFGKSHELHSFLTAKVVYAGTSDDSVDIESLNEPAVDYIMYTGDMSESRLSVLSAWM